MKPEETLFQRNDLAVTTARFMVGSKTYAIRNIVSTRGIEIRPGFLGRLFGKRSEYRVLITTSAGELSAYNSSDATTIADLLDALDKAIASSTTNG
jgi:hypothetical protein